MKTIVPKSNINATVTVPGSKSITHRALIAAALAEGQSTLEAFLNSEDTLLTLEALRKLKIPIILENDRIAVSGCNGRFQPGQDRTEIFLANSGTSYRLLLSIFALAQGEYLLTGTERMQQRPVDDLVNALRYLGADITCLQEDGFPPALLKAKGLQGGRVKLAADRSSQYISSLLLAGPYGAQDLEIEIMGDTVSKPYLDITLNVMHEFGVDVERDAYSFFKVKAGRHFQARSYRIEGDVSSASYFWSAAAVTNGRIVTRNLKPLTSRQGDMAFLDVLQAMGCRVQKDHDRVTIQGAELKAVEADMGSMPDMVPTLAAVALFAKGETRIHNAAHLRIKESDRLASVAREWRRLGAQIEELPDGLHVQGSTPLIGAEVDPHNDHRLAMSLAVIGLRVPGIMIKNETCVAKSFPGFWEWWEKL